MRYFRDVLLCKPRLRINASVIFAQILRRVAIDSRFESHVNRVILEFGRVCGILRNRCGFAMIVLTADA